MAGWLRFAATAVLALGCSAALAQDKSDDHAGHDHGKSDAKTVDGAKPNGAGATEVMCPITGEPIKKTKFAYYKDRRVYVCCDKCKRKIEQDPAKYSEQIKVQWDAMKPVRAQVKCPSGDNKPLDRTIFVEGADDRVYFSSADAKAKWEKGDESMKKRLEESCYTFQTTCPKSGQPIDPTTATDIDGKTVYFCCTGCAGAFKKDVAAGMKSVDEQIKSNQEAWIKQQIGARAKEKKNG